MKNTHANVSQLLPEYLEHLWRFAYHLTQNSDTAQDLTQKTCLRALEYQASCREESMKSWLFKIMHNIWRDEIRYNTKAGLKLVETEAEDLQTKTSESPEQQLLLQEVRQLINQLPEVLRTTMLLTAVEGFSYRETAEMLDIPLGTVMSRLARAREKIGQSVQLDKKLSPSQQSREQS